MQAEMIFSSYKIQRAMLSSRKQVLPLTSHSGRVLCKHISQQTIVTVPFSSALQTQSYDSINNDTRKTADLVVMAIAFVASSLLGIVSSTNANISACDNDDVVRDPMTSYAIHAMIRQMKREEKAGNIIDKKQQQLMQQQKYDVEWKNQLWSGAAMLASSAVSTSDASFITPSESVDQPTSSFHPSYTTLKTSLNGNEAIDTQGQLTTKTACRQRSVSKGGLVDPMTSYAVNSMVREIKREREDEVELINRTKQQQVLQEVSTLHHPLNESNNDNSCGSRNFTNNLSGDVKLTLIRKQETTVSTSPSETANDSFDKSIMTMISNSMSQGSIPGVHGVDLSTPEPSIDNDVTVGPSSSGNSSSTATTAAPVTDLAGEMMTLAEAKIEEATRKAKQHSGGLKIFSGNGNMSLALEICRHLGVNLGKATVGRFADGEVNVVIHENVRGKDVYVVQPTGPPVNDNIMELLLMVSTLRRSSARRITVVIPYYGYARQDRKMQARVPISAADVARLMEAMGIDRVIAVDLHCGQIQGFFGPRVPVDNLDGGIVGLDYFGCKDLHNPVIVSPDAGGVYRAKNFKDGLEQKYEMHDLALAVIVKQRAKAGVVDQMDLVGDVRDCDCIIVDDMIDTAGTLCKAADVLIANGARRVFAFASHGLLSGPGNERIANSQLEEVVILNTLPTSPQREANEKLTELSVAPLLAQAIFNIHAKKSISALFK